MREPQLIDHSIVKRKNPLRWLLTMIILAALLSVLMSLVACTSGPVRKEKPIRVWMIDSSDASLYRHIGTDEEEAMRILGNPEAENFMCYDRASNTELLLRARE